MRKTSSSISIFLSLLLLFAGSLFAQSLRSHVNDGVGLYDKGKYVDSEVEFKKGLEKSPGNFEANFNLGDSYYKEGKYDDAMKSYNAAMPVAVTNDMKAKVYHNIGNSLLKDQKIKESIGAYTESLKLNPNDQATKYNLSYALEMLKDQNKQNKNNKNNQNNKNDQNKNNQNQQNKNDQNKNQNQNNQNNQQNQNKNNQQNQQNQPQPKISKDQAQAIFNALNNDEKDLQKQLRKMAGKPIKTDKDW